MERKGWGGQSEAGRKRRRRGERGWSGLFRVVIVRKVEVSCTLSVEPAMRSHLNSGGGRKKGGGTGREK